MNQEGADTAVWLDRYRLYDEIGAGATSRVYLAKLVGAAGFARTVAVKVLREDAAKDAALRSMFVDEARLSSRIDNPHVVRTLDVVEADGRVGIVMEHVLGASLARALVSPSPPLPVPIAVAIASDVLRGLHAAHEARGEDGLLLGIVHRDVSPSNVLIGRDGRARLIDFGIAKARARLTETASGVTKGKLGYMAPEQREGKPVSRETDIFAVGVLLWELVTGRALFQGDEPGARPFRLLAPSSLRPDVPVALDHVIASALEELPKQRPPTALAMLEALSSAVLAASPVEVARWFDAVAGLELELAEEQLSKIERTAAGCERGPGPSAVMGAPPPAPRASARRYAWPAVAVLVLAGIVIRASSREAPSLAAQSVVKTDARTPPTITETGDAAVVIDLGDDPPKSATPAPPPQRKAAAGKRQRGSCAPPYRFDTEGHKLFIPSCL